MIRRPERPVTTPLEIASVPLSLAAVIACAVYGVSAVLTAVTVAVVPGWIVAKARRSR